VRAMRTATRAIRRRVGRAAACSTCWVRVCVIAAKSFGIGHSIAQHPTGLADLWGVCL
jgi:hypothetical protein